MPFFQSFIFVFILSWIPAMTNYCSLRELLIITFAKAIEEMHVSLWDFVTKAVHYMRDAIIAMQSMNQSTPIKHQPSWSASNQWINRDRQNINHREVLQINESIDTDRTSTIVKCFKSINQSIVVARFLNSTLHILKLQNSSQLRKKGRQPVSLVPETGQFVPFHFTFWFMCTSWIGFFFFFLNFIFSPLG